MADQHPAWGRARAAANVAAETVDRVPGVLRGTADAVQGVQHKSRSGDREHRDSDREAAVYARWAAGLPARNQFERDHYAELEVHVAAGRMHLDRIAKEATAVETAREAEAAEAEAGS
jgi:hypothetical protein